MVGNYAEQYDHDSDADGHAGNARIARYARSAGLCGTVGSRPNYATTKFDADSVSE